MQLTVGGKPALRLAVGAGGQRGEEAVVRLDLLNLIVLKPSTQCGRMQMCTLARAISILGI